MFRRKNKNKWILNRKTEWNEHLKRISHRGLVKVTREKSPLGGWSNDVGNDGVTIFPITTPRQGNRQKKEEESSNFS